MKKPKIFSPKHRTSNKAHKTLNLERDKRQKLYKAEQWKKFSRKFLKENPTCYVCGERSEVTDHLVPHKGDEFIFKETGNHIPLCHKHHNTVTGKFDYKHRSGDSVIEKIDWLNSERSRYELIKDKSFPPVKVITYD